MNCSNCGAAMAIAGTRRHLQCQHCGTYSFPHTVEADGVHVVGLPPEPRACPVCAAAMAQALLDNEHPIDFCTRCRGILLPRTSFAIVTQKRRAWATTPPAEPLPIDPDDLRRHLDCPACGRAFDTHPNAGPGNVVIDNCPRCDLIWLDFGEMQHIVDAPGRDRGGREVQPIDDAYIRRGPDRHATTEDVREERDPLRMLADVLFG